MITIKVSAGSAELAKMFLRQTPGGSGIWGGCKFIVNQFVEKCDWWVICHGSGLQNIESTICDLRHIVYISMEPSESVGNIKQEFLDQFSHLVICDRNIIHPNIIYANGLTWWVGMHMRHQHGVHQFTQNYSLDYDLLKTMPVPEKNNRISVVLSKKNFLEGHKRRLIFIEKIKKLPIGEFIDIFGAGFNPIPDKWEAIAPYKYHLVFENDLIEDYWTEKLADAFLGFCYPIYVGCPNIADFFPKESLLTIDINDVESSANKLVDLLRNDAYSKYFSYICVSRDKIMNEYNIFQMMSNVCVGVSSKGVKCTLTPNHHFSSSRLKLFIRKALYKNKLALSLVRRLRGMLSL